MAGRVNETWAICKMKPKRSLPPTQGEVKCETEKTSAPIQGDFLRETETNVAPIQGDGIHETEIGCARSTLYSKRGRRVRR